MDAVRGSYHSTLAGDLEVNKALMYLKQRELKNAIDTLKVLQKNNESRLATTAATNLSFIFYHVSWLSFIPITFFRNQKMKF